MTPDSPSSSPVTAATWPWPTRSRLRLVGIPAQNPRTLPAVVIVLTPGKSHRRAEKDAAMDYVYKVVRADLSDEVCGAHQARPGMLHPLASPAESNMNPEYADIAVYPVAQRR